MKGKMAAGLLVAFALASASEGDPADRRSGGGRAVGRAGGPSPGAGAHSGGHAVSRGSGVRRGQAPPTGAQRRHPRAGTGTGGYNYGGGYGGYGGYGHYPYHGYYPYYRYYPYWGYFPFPGYGLGPGLSFYYGEGYTSPYYAAPYNSAPYYAAPPAGGAGYYGGGGGYGSAPAPAPEPADAAVLLLEVVPDDASVWIDDEFRGVARDLARLALPPGRHRVEVVRPGFRTFTQEVELGPGSATALRIELERP